MTTAGLMEDAIGTDEAIVARVVRAVRGQVGADVPESEVEHEVRAALATFQDARIQAFVPLFATRMAVDRLRSAAGT